MNARSIFASCTIVALTLATAVAYGLGRIAVLMRADEAPELQVVALQLDLDRTASPAFLYLDRPGHSESAIELSRDALRDAPECDLVVWPELPLSLGALGAVCRRGDGLSRRLGRPLLMHCARDAPDGSLSTAELYDHRTGTRAWHAKSSLVPLYERSLWGEQSIISGSPGTVMELNGNIRVAPALCYELHSRRHMRQASLAGAQVVAHMASFTPFRGHPIDIWDLEMAQIRAVEFRMPIVRSVNRGASGWVDAVGNIRDSSARHGSGARCLAIDRGTAGATLFARLGPIAPWLPGLLMVSLSVALRICGRRCRTNPPPCRR